MTFNQQTLNLIEGYGENDLSPSQIFLLLKLKQSERELFMYEFTQEHSLVFQAYHRGQTALNLALNKSLIEHAKEGCVDSAALLQQRKQAQVTAEILHETFGV